MSEELSKELDDFLGSGIPSEPPTEPPAEPPVEPPNAPPVEPSVEPPTEPPAPSEPPVEPPTPPTPPVEPPVEPPAEPPAAPSGDDETIALLRAQIEDLQGKLVEKDKPTEPAAPVEPPAPPAAPEPPKPLNFLEGKNLEDILDDPVKFNEMLVSVYERGKADSRDLAAEKVLKSIPQLVATYASRHTSMTGMVSDFYKKNQDLANVKKTVAAVANEVAAEHPDWSIQQVFDESAVRARKVLGMKGGITPPATPPVTPPATPPIDPPFVDQSGRRAPGGPQLKGLEKEVNELIS